jgi:hypothetical protein
MTNHPIEGVACIPKDNNLGVWQVFVEGPKGSPFDGGVFELEMGFPNDYPDNPPTLYFKSEFWHPNIYPDGKGWKRHCCVHRPYLLLRSVHVVASSFGRQRDGQ